MEQSCLFLFYHCAKYIELHLPFCVLLVNNAWEIGCRKQLSVSDWKAFVAGSVLYCLSLQYLA